jgi:transcriptional regulator with XRE-family HTH domain
MSIGNNIKILRKEKKLTQKELASLANISRSYLGDVENDRYNPSVDTLHDIAKALNTTAQQLLKEDINTNDEIDILEEELKSLVDKYKNISTDNRKKLLKMIELFEDEN